MTGIPTEINNRLRDTLPKCTCFQSNGTLKAVFADASIASWRLWVPDNTTDVEQRVNLIIDKLHDQYSDTGQNALVQFLRVLQGLQDDKTELRDQLATLVNDLEEQFTEEQRAKSTPPETATEQQLSIQDLIAMIVSEDDDGDLLVRSIARVFPHSRASAYLGIKEGELPEDSSYYSDTAVKEIAVRYLFTAYGPSQAMLDICAPELLNRVLVNLQCELEVTEEPTLSTAQQVEEVVAQILGYITLPTNEAKRLETQTVHISLPLPWKHEPDNVVRRPTTGDTQTPLLQPVTALKELRRIELSFEKFVRRQHFDLSWAQQLSDSAWDLVTSMLRFSLAFASLSFQDLRLESLVPIPVPATFDEVTRCMDYLQRFFLFGIRERDSLWGRVESPSYFSGLRKCFLQQLPNKRVKDIRDKAFYTTLTEHETVTERENPDIAEQEKVKVQCEIERLKRRSRDAQNECWRRFGRSLPLGYMQNRIFVPHHLRSFEEVNESLQQVKAIIYNLLHVAVVPRVVKVDGQGEDVLDNRVVLFTDSTRRTVTTYSEMEWMFFSEQKDYEPFTEYAMLAPVSAEREPLIDPTIFPLTEIKARLEGENSIR